LKILCISDKIDPLVYSLNIKERFSDVELILSAGDLPLYYLDFIISSLNKPLFFVFGNHHLESIKHFKKQPNGCLVQEDTADFCCGAVHLGSKIKTEGEIIIAGLGGSIRYNRGNNQYTDFQMFLEIVKLIPRLLWNRLVKGRYIDILLTHAPPKGIHDRKDKCHNGFRTYLWFMKVFKPKYLIHGHIHLYDMCESRCTKWEDTMVINAYNHYVIETGDNNGS